MDSVYTMILLQRSGYLSQRLCVDGEKYLGNVLEPRINLDM